MKTEAYINKIIEETGLSRKEIEEHVIEKKNELKGLISDEGALFVIAKELGVDVSRENKDLISDIELSISDITPNMKNVVVVGRIKDIYNVSSFTKKNGEAGYVGSFLLNDTTGDIRVVLWDDQVKIFNDDRFKVNEMVKVNNATAKENRFQGVEIQVGRFGNVILAPEDIDYKKYPKVQIKKVQIKNINGNIGPISIEGRIDRIFPINEFIKKDGTPGKVQSVILLDPTGTIRISFWNEDLELLNEFAEGDYVSINSLNPRESNYNLGTYDLHATRRSKLIKKDKELKFDTELVKNIKELQNKKNYVSFQGIITSINDLKRVTLKSGEEIPLLSLVISDDTDGIRLNIWGENAEKFANSLSNNDGILLKNVRLRFNNFSNRNEATFIASSTIENVDIKIDNLKPIESSQTEKGSSFSRNITQISEIDSPGFYEIKGYVANEINRINVYEACSKCGRKYDNCVCDSKGEKVNRMIINQYVEDESGRIRTTFIGETAEKLIGIKPEVILEEMDKPDYDNFLENLSVEIVGRDMMIKGRAKFSDYSNTYELMTSDFKEIAVEEEIKQKIKEIET